MENKTVDLTQGNKLDQGKNQLDLVPPELVEGVGLILTYGAQKYDRHNWRKGIKYSRVVSALLRHLYAYLRGEKVDPESSYPHLFHIGCNLAFLIYFDAHPEKYQQFDDLFDHQGDK